MIATFTSSHPKVPPEHHDTTPEQARRELINAFLRHPSDTAFTFTLQDHHGHYIPNITLAYQNRAITPGHTPLIENHRTYLDALTRHLDAFLSGDLPTPVTLDVRSPRGSKRVLLPSTAEADALSLSLLLRHPEGVPVSFEAHQDGAVAFQRDYDGHQLSWGPLGLLRPSGTLGGWVGDAFPRLWDRWGKPQPSY